MSIFSFRRFRLFVSSDPLNADDLRRAEDLSRDCHWEELARAFVASRERDVNFLIRVTVGSFVILPLFLVLVSAYAWSISPFLCIVLAMLLLWLFFYLRRAYDVIQHEHAILDLAYRYAAERLH